MRRRALLSVLATMPVASVDGCLSNAPMASSSSEPSARSPPSESKSTTKPDPKPVQCQGDPISITRTLTDTSGYDDDIEYFPANHTVRFVAMRGAEGPASFDTMSFDKWASIKCAELGVDRVRNVTATRLGTNQFGSSIGQPPGFFSTQSLVIWLEVATQVEDRKTVATPSVALSHLAEVAPRSVHATVSLKGDTYSRTVPVFCRHVEIGLA